MNNALIETRVWKNQKEKYYEGLQVWSVLTAKDTADSGKTLRNVLLSRQGLCSDKKPAQMISQQKTLRYIGGQQQHYSTLCVMFILVLFQKEDSL